LGTNTPARYAATLTGTAGRYSRYGIRPGRK
jgi:hypothetical protein